MAVCEKCWADAYLRTMSNPSKAQVDHYLDLLQERKDNPCKETVCEAAQAREEVPEGA